MQFPADSVTWTGPAQGLVDAQAGTSQKLGQERGQGENGSFMER